MRNRALFPSALAIGAAGAVLVARDGFRPPVGIVDALPFVVLASVVAFSAAASP